MKNPKTAEYALEVSKALIEKFKRNLEAIKRDLDTTKDLEALFM